MLAGPSRNGPKITTISGHTHRSDTRPPADYAGIIDAIGSNAAQDESITFPPVAQAAPFGVSKTINALIAAG